MVASASKSTADPDVITCVEKSVNVTALTKFNEPPPAPVPLIVAVDNPPLPSIAVIIIVASFNGLAPPSAVPAITSSLPT